MRQDVVDIPCHGDKELTLTEDKLVRPPDVPEDCGTAVSSSWRYAFHTAH